MVNSKVANETQSGQAVIEYIMLLAVVIGSYMTLASWFTRFGFAEKLTRPITKSFAHAYQYGDVEALGFDDGGPKRHPRANTRSNENFRIFINPEIR